MSSPEMPEMFDRLTAQVGDWAARHPGPPEEFELSSTRELTATDPEGLVSVTMKDFKVERIEFDSYWYEQSDPRPRAKVVAAATAAAVNAVLTQYLREEILEAQSHALPMSEVYEGLKTLSADFEDAFTRAMARIPSGEAQ
ncbi:hypothetical protein ACPCG0_07640 [Propionibacteriaceae bacterium Y1923]